MAASQRRQLLSLGRLDAKSANDNGPRRSLKPSSVIFSRRAEDGMVTGSGDGVVEIPVIFEGDETSDLDPFCVSQNLCSQTFAVSDS